MLTGRIARLRSKDVRVMSNSEVTSQNVVIQHPEILLFEVSPESMEQVDDNV